MSYNCPLCGSSSHFYYESIKPFPSKYNECDNCQMVFMHPELHILGNDEKVRYENHNNSIDSPGYVNFINNLLIPFKEFLSKDMQGLDFGCGPGPVLVELMQKEGFAMEAYDPYFAPKELSKSSFDFITSTEVVEHFHHPIESFKKMIELLKPKGKLGIMTSILYEDIDFDSWYYRYDNTHICFYRPKTLRWIEKEFSLNTLVENENVIIWELTS